MHFYTNIEKDGNYWTPSNSHETDDGQEEDSDDFSGDDADDVTPDFLSDTNALNPLQNEADDYEDDDDDYDDDVYDEYEMEETNKVEQELDEKNTDKDTNKTKGDGMHILFITSISTHKQNCDNYIII